MPEGANTSIPTRPNPDLQAERDAASFDVGEFQTWWHEGADKLRVKRELEKFLHDHIPDDGLSVHYQSHEQHYISAMKSSIEVAKKLRILQEKQNPGGNDIWPNLLYMPVVSSIQPAGNPFTVQFVMMTTALKSEATDEQYERFGKRAENFEVCGTYAQTELGHGTFLRGLETRADYDAKTQEFVLNTPTLTSYKWWPGGLGHSSNHCVLVAQLYINNQRKGIQMFYVQLRDEDTHMPLPGIDIGEVGKKLGFLGYNNGYLGLKNVRIPRTNMLMRNAQVLPDGTFQKGPFPVLAYFTMVYTRCLVSLNNANMLCMAATIATRYSAVRRQSRINPHEPEPQIIDHVTQQLKLFPELATAIAHRLSASCLYLLYQQTSAEIERGEYSRLPEMHTLACCMKVLCTSDSAAGVERLRLACGGHGYLAASNFGLLFVDAAAACTYEGENTVLLLQVGRFLMKAWRAALDGDQLPPTVLYLAEAAALKQFPKWTGSWECIIKAFQFVAANKTRLAFEHLSQRLKEGQTKAEAANNTGIEYVQAAELHGRVFICSTFLEEVTGGAANLRSPTLNNVLRNLLELFLVHTTLRHMNDLLRFIPLTETDLSALQTRLEAALKKVRPDAVAICDGFDYRDRSLNSVLGSYDGNVYERIFESAKKSPLNKTPVPKVFHQYLKPFLKSNM